MSRPRKVWVIGAGLAGLSAAVQLTRAGVKVRLVEAAPRAGGPRSGPVRFPRSGR